MTEETHEERARRLGVPYIKPLERPKWGPNPVVAVCGGCGRDVHRIEGYSCPHRGECPMDRSPTFLGGTWSGQ